MQASETPATEVLRDRSILFDCRWLGFGGAGRVTEIVLRDFGTSIPPGRWTLWGTPSLVEPFRFPGSGVRPWHGDPRSLAGQRDVLQAGGVDIVVYAHQMRPLRPGLSVTFILDTIPIRHGGSAPLRLAKRMYLQAVARLSTRVLTLSEHSRRSLVRDLGVGMEKIDIVPLPIDLDRARSIARRRNGRPPAPVLLYVGRFDRHKNLERLCLAFSQTKFAGSGGRLLLVGGWRGELEYLRAQVGMAESIEVRSTCSERELDDLYATSRAVVLPSLEEGYGLPAFEAAACGLPVAASRTGAMAEMPPEAATLFDPMSVSEMRQAIDEVVKRPIGREWILPAADPGRVVTSAVAAAIGSAHR